MTQGEGMNTQQLLESRLRLAFAVFDADDKCVARHSDCCVCLHSTRVASIVLWLIHVLQRSHQHRRIQGVSARDVQAGAACSSRLAG